VDAVEGQVAKTNLKFGYIEAGMNTARFAGPAKEAVEGVQPYTEGKLLPASDVPFDDIHNYDNTHFVSANAPQRKHFLTKWIANPDGSTYVALDNKDNVTGFGCIRGCCQEGNYLVGPLYADNSIIAENILQKLCAGVSGSSVTINFWDRNEEAHKMVQKFGFEKVFQCVRMHVNGDAKEYKASTFAVTSIDVCGF
jgi:hypothetical protein